MCVLVSFALAKVVYGLTANVCNAPGFMCDRIGDQSFLRVQYTLECGGGKRRAAYVLWGWLMILLYPIGKSFDTRACCRAVSNGLGTPKDCRVECARTARVCTTVARCASTVVWVPLSEPTSHSESDGGSKANPR